MQDHDWQYYKVLFFRSDCDRFNEQEYHIRTLHLFPLYINSHPSFKICEKMKINRMYYKVVPEE